MSDVIHALGGDHDEGGVVSVGHILPRHVDHLVIGVSGPAVVILNSVLRPCVTTLHIVILTSIRGTGEVLDVS